MSRTGENSLCIAVFFFVLFLGFATVHRQFVAGCQHDGKKVEGPFFNPVCAPATESKDGKPND